MITVRYRMLLGLALGLLIGTTFASAQSGSIVGTVRDETGDPLPGVSVELIPSDGDARFAETDALGTYRFDGPPPGDARLVFALVNFANARRAIAVPVTGEVRADVVLQLSLSADVTVTAKHVREPRRRRGPPRSLVGIAQSASQGAITARQLETRPMMRAGEVLETVPGVIISQHSGEGKANQYYLRGFNLDHGTDFATTVAGMPVNMPTHAHGHGYSDLNFLIPELVSGVQFSKGPYFAEQGDFATAGAANINYVNRLDRPIVRVDGGGEGYGRGDSSRSRRRSAGDSCWRGLESQHNDGPWARPDDFRRVNGVLRYSQGDAVNGFSVTGMGYDGRWTRPTRSLSARWTPACLDRFGTLDASDGGDSYRYSGSVEWQRTQGNAATKVTAYGIALRPGPVLELHVLPRRPGAAATSSSRSTIASSAARR